MNFGKIKKLAIASALALTVGVAASAAGCSVATDHPRAKITFQLIKSETDIKEYSLEYTLYRNMYPQTVKHFIELSKAGFYDNTIVHDYTSNEWITGLYDYKGYAEYSDAIENSGSMGDYYADNSKEEKYLALFASSALTASVYGNTDFKIGKDGKISYDSDGHPIRVINKEYALPTVMGEFKNNINQEIKNGALTNTSGCLKMIYYPASSSADASNKKVYVTPTSDQIIQADFKYNSATSAFAVQLGTSSYDYLYYTVFGKVTDNDDLDELKKAVKDYFEEAYGSTDDKDHYVSTSAEVPVYGPAANGDGYEKDTVSTSFNAPKTAIVIKSVKITKN